MVSYMDGLVQSNVVYLMLLIVDWVQTDLLHVATLSIQPLLGLSCPRPLVASKRPTIILLSLLSYSSLITWPK